MKMTRRAFGVGAGLFSLAIATGMSLFTTGCGFVDDLLGVLPAILTALSNIVAMIQNAGVSLSNNVLAIVGKIAQVGGALLAALRAYKAGTPGTTLMEIDALLGDFLTAFQNLITGLPPLPATIITLVLMGLQVILGTIEGFLNQMPPASLPKGRQRLLQLKTMRLQGKTLIVATVTKPGARQFKHDFNAIPGLPSQYHV